MADVLPDEIWISLYAEVARQDLKHGPFTGSAAGASRLALACLEDEVREALAAWREERTQPAWDATRAEVIQVAAVALRAVRDALGPFTEPPLAGESNVVESGA